MQGLGLELATCEFFVFRALCVELHEIAAFSMGVGFLPASRFHNLLSFPISQEMEIRRVCRRVLR